jgi:septum formation topological specificity factor MinE
VKIYKYWTVEKRKIKIDGAEQEINCYGGSNISVVEARLRAREKAEKIQRKIAGERHVFDRYEAEIREEILQVIDDHSAITRNRYGAQVLNTESLMILDIDKPKATGGLFKKKDTRPPKDQIFEMVRNLAASAKYKDYGFRTYETYQGARVIVMGNSFDPRNSETRKMMDEFNCDPLYTTLCNKQGCFRARLTPKPYRMKMRPYKVNFPREDIDTEFQRWLADYESESRNFSVCKFIEQVGASHYVDKVIQLHDEVTGVGYPQRLA